MLKFIRNFHLYSGLFFTPAIVFFAVSGALQTFDLHENKEGVYTAPEWIAAIAEVHKNQRLHNVQPDKPQPTEVKEVTSEKQQKAASSPMKKRNKRPKSLLLQIFVALMSIGLILSALTGIYMAFKFKRDRKLIALAIISGVLLPVAFLVL
ncbi:MAG: hypothetical protein P4L53_15605 [Candidatus Obscuribacterales bacterium]|nr:hypothetical protein [Candidatus Obscuribacterales bacterium]